MQLRALSYNIHKGIGGLDRRYDLDRIQQVIGSYQPDLLLLQEVSQKSPRCRHERQVDLLAEACGLRHYTYFINHRFKRNGEYGNAILSRFPITSTENISVKLPAKKARSVLHAKVRVREGRRTRTVHVFNLHLGLAEFERRIQLRKFLQAHPFAGLHPRTPVLVAGDFNDVWGSLGSLLAPYGFRGVRRRPRTFPAFAPIRALDSLYVRGDMHLDQIHASRLALARQASDHRPLVAQLTIRSRNPA